MDCVASRMSDIMATSFCTRTASLSFAAGSERRIAKVVVPIGKGRVAGWVAGDTFTGAGLFSVTLRR